MTTQIFRPSGGGSGGASVPAEGRPKPSGGSSAYTIPGVDILGISTNAPSINQIRYMPIYVATQITVDQMACEVTTLGASAQIRLGLYNADTDWQPTSLVVDAGTVSGASTGVKTASISQTLAAGRYLMAINTDVSVTFRTWRGGTRYAQILAAMGTNSVNDLWFINNAFGAFAGTGVAWTGTNGSSTVGMIYYCALRISTP